MAEYIITIEGDRIVKATEVVRCRACEHWHENDFVDGLSYGECDNGVIKKSVWTNETWFCKDGERRADEAD